MRDPFRFPAGARVALAALLAAAVAAPGHAAAPRAEIQVGLCGAPPDVVRALDLVPRGAAYDTWLFDDPSLALLTRGVRLRLRMHATRPELTLKIADQDCRALPPGLLPAGQGKCEYDVHGAAVAGAVSLDQQLTASTASGLLDGQPLDAALSGAQRRYLDAVIGPLPPGVRPLGPIAKQVLRTRDGRYDVDLSTLPDGSQTVEISIKVPLADVPAAQSALADRLAAARVAPCGDQAGQAMNKLRSLAGRSAR